MQNVIVDTGRVYRRKNEDIKFYRRQNTHLVPHLMAEDEDGYPDVLDSWDNSPRKTMRPKARLRHERNYFGDRLNPIYRFLEKRLGQQWDAVYSEISAHTDMRSVMGEHLRLHLKWVVDEHPEIQEDGTYTGYWFYVHPDTGVLSRDSRKRKRKSYTPEITSIPVKKSPNEFYVLRKSDGLWFKVTQDVQVCVSSSLVTAGSYSYRIYEYNFKEAQLPKGIDRCPHLSGYVIRKVRSASKKDLKYIRKVLSFTQ
tara:strand:- start:10038 stop:10799 length:762 start_codon:yes stop_codon:yes gene_type:complete